MDSVGHSSVEEVEQSVEDDDEDDLMMMTDVKPRIKIQD